MPLERPLLRRQLLGWLLAPLALLLAADTFVSYWVALSFSQQAHDRTLLEVARELSLYLRPAQGGALVLRLPQEARRLLFTDPVDRLAFEAAEADGRTVAGERLAPAPAAARRGAEALYDGALHGVPARIVELRLAPQPGGRPAAIVRVAETMEKRNALAREILASVVLPQLLLIAIAGAVVWLGVVRGLRPLDRLRHAVAARSHRDRSPLADDKVPGEVSPLLEAINDLLARLDRALTLQSRFIADAAHQLKTPIAALRAQYEVALREPEPARQREALRQLEPGLDRLSRIVSQLLSLARNEPEAAQALRFAPLDLNALALEAATAWVPRALERRIDLGFEGAPAAVSVRGDLARLRELLDNLLDNAVRYSRAGGRVTVRVHAAPAAIVEVNDDGPGIPPGERERVFERFHRLLGSGQEGSGLGLAIAQEIARLHGAEIGLREDADGVGNTFSLRFPAAA
jgi:two-component system sensor histidine kinase TctE